MAGIFLSYARDDTAKARPIAAALEAAGHTVWWDLHVRGGAQFSKVIEEALKAADVVVVLWSAQSVESAWVRDEAASGRDRGRLVPVSLDQTEAPLGFRQFQTIDFSRWKGRGKPPGLAEHLHAIDSLADLEGASEEPQGKPRSVLRQSRMGGMSPLAKWSLIGGAVMLALLIIGPLIGLLSRGDGQAGVHTVSVSAADDAAKPLARDLLVNLNRLQSAKSGSVRLLSGQDAEADPELIFEAASASDPSKIGASVVLMNGRDRSILWSRDFEQPSGKLADLKQQVSFSAGRVLDCALEGLNAVSGELKPQSFKLYLNGCAQLSETASADPSPLISIFRRVVEESPGFEPGWANLLLVESEIAWAAQVHGQPSTGEMEQFRRDIAAAEKLNPKMPEVILAKVPLLPLGAYAESMQLIERAAAVSTDNPLVLAQRADFLRRVGRQRESVEDAKRAADLDPLSPFTRNAYISALAYAGRFGSAKAELAKAEQLWPGTATLEDIKLRFHLRYGDPNEALRLFQEMGEEGSSNDEFLRTRLNPTPENVDKLVARMRQRLPVVGAGGLGFAIQAYGEFGRNDEIADILLKWPNPNDLMMVSDIFFRPTSAGLRKDPRFMVIAKRAGLVDYWRKSGKWPDFCFEPGLPYDCKAEAAKLG